MEVPYRQLDFGGYMAYTALRYYKPLSLFLMKARKCLKISMVDNTVNTALKGNIFRTRDFEAEKEVKYAGINGNSLTRKWKSK
jgi:hypothetical protein